MWQQRYETTRLGLSWGNHSLRLENALQPEPFVTVYISSMASTLLPEGQSVTSSPVQVRARMITISGLRMFASSIFHLSLLRSVVVVTAVRNAQADVRLSGTHLLGRRVPLVRSQGVVTISRGLSSDDLPGAATHALIL